MRKDSGFTLIEVIVTLVIVGLLASVAGMGIVTNAKVYVLARDNTALAQKARFGLQRLTKELRERYMTSITTADPTSIAFNYEDSGPKERSIALVSGTIKLTNSLTPPTLSDDTLIDGVNSFTLGYLDKDKNTWNGADLDDLYFITLELVLDWHAGETQTFSTTVTPRQRRISNP
ncbi:prepilin-type N-terminal cleavage/methylation domain-containing protein [Patescibacteria group bacterium]|nr:prepilin-type N-terminal cleavage/methylation domain-containing protein [Patescibacteria group bacterium]